MSQVLYPNQASLYFMDRISKAVADAGAIPPVTANLRLFKNDVPISPSTVVGDLVEADFSGYTAKSITALLPEYLDPEGGSSAQIATQQFDHNGGATSNVVYGFYLQAGAVGAELLLVGKFDQGIPMNAVGDSIPIDVKFNFGG